MRSTRDPHVFGGGLFLRRVQFIGWWEMKLLHFDEVFNDKRGQEKQGVPFPAFHFWITMTPSKFSRRCGPLVLQKGAAWSIPYREQDQIEGSDCSSKDGQGTRSSTKSEPIVSSRIVGM